MRSFDTIITALISSGYDKKQWYIHINSIVFFTKDLSMKNNLEIISRIFSFNPFYFDIFKAKHGKLNILYQPVLNFYLQEPIAQNSLTRAECSRFLFKENNFNIDI